MGERTILVCDNCGRPAIETVTISRSKTKAKVQKDVCSIHLGEYEAGGRRPRPGRKRATVDATAVVPKRRGRPPKTLTVVGAA